MPVNLNALLRYKVIDSCLSNSQSNCTITHLISKCSHALSNANGVTSVSERTIRNDIRILRSDILGFNAPIVVNDGVYTYSDKTFSIFNRPINELELLIEIQELLIENFPLLENQKLKVLLKELSLITEKKINPMYLPDADDILPLRENNLVSPLDIYIRDLNSSLNARSANRKKFYFKTSRNKTTTLKTNINWEFIFRTLK